MDNDEINAVLSRIFPGDPVPDVTDDDGSPPPPVLAMPSWRTTTRRRVIEQPPVVSRATTEKFERLMAAPPPVQLAVSVPSKQYVVTDKANAELWLREAREIESDIKLGLAVAPHHATRLMLDAIPAVEQLLKA